MAGKSWQGYQVITKFLSALERSLNIKRGLFTAHDLLLKSLQTITKPLKSSYLIGLAGVFASAAFFSYSWSLLVFFWDLPSFLFRWSIGDIIGFVAYQFMFKLAGSLTVTIFIAMLGLIFPSKYLRNNIRTSGTALVIAFAINSILFKERLGLIQQLAGILSVNVLTIAKIATDIWIAGLVILPIGLVIVSRNKKVEAIINGFVEHLDILVSVYVILSLLGILIVIIRNID